MFLEKSVAAAIFLAPSQEQISGKFVDIDTASTENNAHCNGSCSGSCVGQVNA